MHTSFERLCRDLVSLVLASAAVSACGGGVDSGSDPTKGPNGPSPSPSAPATEEPSAHPTEWSLACSGGEAPTASGLEGFTPEPAVDFLAERVESVPYGGDSEATKFDKTKLVVTQRASRGTPCASATDSAACTKKLADIRAVAQESDCTYGQTGTCYASYFVYTRGDEVGLLRNEPSGKTRATMLSFLGKIDTPAEAFFMAEQSGLYGQCYGPDTERARFRRVGSSIEIVVIESGCQKEEKRIVLRVNQDGTEEILAQKSLGRTGACAGRRPDGFIARGGEACTSAVGEHLALIAELEDAAVHAFANMVEELGEAGAPADLVARARAARMDEIRHTRTMTKLARQRGGSPRRASVAPRASRSLRDIAIENAMEGCVREAYAALVTLFQAERAADPELRAALGRIAVDEVAHAKLSLDVATWLDGILGDEERASVTEAREQAFRDLARELEAETDPEVREHVGLPSRREAHALLAATRALAA